MTLTNPIDLNGVVNPKLKYWTKFDIESDYDYGQVQISTNNGTTWIALTGQYTEPGVGSIQPNGEPVYDGSRSNWVKEEISLMNYSSSPIKIRYRLRTDSNTTRDGWYLDDIGVFYYTIPTDVLGNSEPVYEFSLDQNYPNPFNPNTTLSFVIGHSSFVTLKVYDVLGNEVATLVDGEKPAGSYEVEFDASGLSSGMYFYKLQTGNFVETKKMLLLK
jgi:hypothetical protein